MRKYALVVCSVLLLSLNAFAADAAKGGDPISPNQGSDQCGLAWQVTQNKTILATWTRATTNYFLPPSFSMTSGTSGCQKHEIAKKDLEGVKYVATNLEPLSAEMAQGGGEYVNGLAAVMGCDASVNGTFGQMTQQNFRAIVDGDAVQTYRNLKAEMGKNPLLVVGCGAV